MPVIAARRVGSGLARDTRAAALLEFGLAFPILLAMGGWGVELSNLAITNLRVSQAALQLADNASRIGVAASAATFQLREGDINDVLQGARLTGQGIKLTTYGRVTVSSLENIQQSYDSTPVQRIHWQRCIGLKSGIGTAAVPQWDSSYGTTSTGAGYPAASSASDPAAGTASSGMGSSPVVSAPQGSAVIFVEVNYQYQPLFGTLFIKNATKLHYVASFIVRDKRDFSQIFRPAVASGTPTPVPSTCDKYTT